MYLYFNENLSQINGSFLSIFPRSTHYDGYFYWVLLDNDNTHFIVKESIWFQYSTDSPLDRVGD